MNLPVILIAGICVYVGYIHSLDLKMKDINKNNKEIVILLHGIGHAAPFMHFTDKALNNAGYKTLNITYPSTRKDLKSLCIWLDEKLEKEGVWKENNKVHFVAHSMGGLLTGLYLEKFQKEIPEGKLGRVVMMGTPHGGSEVANALKDLWLYKKIFGPAGQELITSVRNNNKIKPYYDLGIIAGSKNWFYPLGMIFIKDQNDGCVSVESTKLEGMKDHIVISVHHGFMSWKPEIHRQIIYFLEKGEFNHGK